MTPNGWKSLCLGDIASLIAGINKPLSAMGRGTLYLTVQELYIGSHVDPDSLGRIDLTPDEIVRFGLQTGDIIFGKSSVKREGIGYPNQFIGAREPVVHSGFTYAARPNKQVMHPGYLLHALRSEPSRKWIINNSQASALTNINAQIARAIPVLVPPLAEQQAIAEALTDADALVDSLDVLIAKKRDMKQAAMQQLLTGRTRLPGFTDEWREIRLGDCGTFSKGQGIKKDEVLESGLPCIRYGQIYTDHNDWIRSFTAFISSSTAQESRRLVCGDLLFTGSGETASEIGKCVAFLSDVEAYAGGDIVIFAPRDLDSKFMGYVLNGPSAVQQKTRLAQGDAVVHISAASLATLLLSVPSLVEQQAISEVLSDMDAEIEALVAQREKAELVKQGMMQELLSGRVRLV